MLVAKGRPFLSVIRILCLSGILAVSRVACYSKLGSTLHVRKYSVTVPYLENGWTECAQIWCTVRDRLAGCHAQVSWRYPVAVSHAQGPLSRSVRWSPQKALCWCKASQAPACAPPPQRKKLALAVRTVRMSGYMHMMSLLRHLPLGAKAPSGGIIFFG